MPKFRRKPYGEKSLADSQNFLIQPYFSKEIAESLSRDSLEQNAFYAFVLSQVPFQFDGDSKLRVLDVGSKHFVYAPALAHYLTSLTLLPIDLKGLEIDTRRLYRDLYFREDYARYYVEVGRRMILSQSRISYEKGDWLHWKSEQPLDLITCFFPFLYSDLHDRFGLKRNSFQPQEFYRKLFSEANQVILFHQGANEKRDSKALLAALGAKIHFEGSFLENPYCKRKFTVEVIWASMAHSFHSQKLR